MASDRKRCVFGCPTTGRTIHSFPKPHTDPKRFKVWVELAGLEGLPSEKIYPNKKVCDVHFTSKHKNRNSRLNALAVPSLFLPEKALRKKLKNFRDQFMKKITKISVPRSGDAGTGESDSSWPYFQLMLFIKDDVTPKVNEGNLEETINEYFNNERFPTPQSTAESSTSTENSSKLKNTQDIRSEFMELEKKKLDLLQSKLSQSCGSQEQDCEDLLFFKVCSYIPMKQLSHMQKLRTRNKITQIIMDEMNSVGYGIPNRGLPWLHYGVLM